MCVFVRAEVESEDYGEKFTMDNFLDKEFKPKKAYVRWLPGE